MLCALIGGALLESYDRLFFFRCRPFFPALLFGGVGNLFEIYSDTIENPSNKNPWRIYFPFPTHFTLRDDYDDG